MTKSKVIGLLSVLLVLSVNTARADWSTVSRVEQIDIGGNGMHGTFVSLENFSFSGCTATAVGLLQGSNANYKDFIAALLAAKMADRDVKLSYSGCSGGYSLITEVVLP